MGVRSKYSNDELEFFDFSREPGSYPTYCKFTYILLFKNNDKILIYITDSSGEWNDFDQEEDPVKDFTVGMLKTWSYTKYC